MIDLTGVNVLIPLIVFCRVGACFMVMPGISSDRVPAQLRLFVALAVALSITPLLADDVRAVATTTAGDLLALIMLETVVGLFLGFLVRIFFLALEFAAIGMANFAGYGSVFSHAVDGNDPSTPFSAFVTMPALALFFITDQHINVIRMLRDSYGPLKIGVIDATAPDLSLIVSTFGSAFKLTLQLSAALVVYSLMINMAFGFLNKMVPQIPSYFISTPFVVLGGLVLLLQIDKSMLELFSSLVSQAIATLGHNG